MDFILKKPWLILIIFAVIVVGAGHRSLFLIQDNSPDALFAADGEATALYKRMVKTFGTDEMVLIQLRGAKSTNTKDLYQLAKLTREISKIPGVDGVFSASMIFDTDFSEALEKPGKEVIKLVQDEVSKILMYKSLGIVRNDIPALSVAAMITMHGLGARTRFNRKLGEVMARYQKAGYKTLVAGLTPANAAIEREGKRVQELFMPLVGVILILICYIMFRSFSAILVMGLPVAGAIVLGMAGLEVFGERLSLMNTVLPQLILVIGFAGAIHILTRYGSWRGEGKSVEEAVKLAMGEKTIPTLFAFGTTTIGFGSLALSDVAPIRVLGIASSATLLVTMFFILLITPALILVLKPKVRSKDTQHRLLETAAKISLKHRWVVLTVAAILVVFVTFGILQIDTQITAIEMLGDRVSEKQNFLQLEREGFGLGNVDVWLHHKAKNFKELLETARKFEKMNAELRKLDRVTTVVSVVDNLKIFNMRTNKRATLPEGLMVLKLADEDELKQLNAKLGYFWAKEKGMKLVILTRSAREREIREICQRIKLVINRHFPGKRVDLTGHYLMMLGTPGSLLRTLAFSLSITVFVVFALFFVAFRQPFLALSAMATNVLPVAVVIGFTGWIEVPMDVATAMVGSIGFGLAVDNSFHYIYHFKREGSVVKGAHICSKGLVATTLILATGFLVLGLSGFNPVMRFGVFTSLAVVSALLSNSLMLPALIGGRAEAAVLNNKPAPSTAVGEG